MIFLACIAVAAGLCLAPFAQALPASYKHGSIVAAASRRDEKILRRIHDEPTSRFAKNDSHLHQNSPRNVQFPTIFYLPQRRDTADDESRNRASDVNLLSDQNGLPPAAQHAPIPIPNTSVTLIPRPTPVDQDKFHPATVTHGAKATHSEKFHKTMTRITGEPV
jgi:hypothetical protein